MTILVVDDSTERLNALVQLLERVFSESTVIAESDALAAGKFCFNNPVDALFAAVEMPRLDGLKLMEFARHANPNVMIFLLVDPGSDSDEALLEGAADGLIRCPVTETRLLAALRESGGPVPPLNPPPPDFTAIQCKKRRMDMKHNLTFDSADGQASMEPMEDELLKNVAGGLGEMALDYPLVSQKQAEGYLLVCPSCGGIRTVKSFSVSGGYVHIRCSGCGRGWKYKTQVNL